MGNYRSSTKIWFTAVWFATSTTALVFAIVFSVYLSTTKIVNPQITGSNFKLYAALPETENVVSQDIIYADARSKLVQDFFSSYKSPLADLGDHFIQTADKYHLDWKLLPAIAMQESNGGKRVIKDSFNPFGYGIYGKLVTRFASWEEAVERVGQGLREDYLDQGLKTPNQIMAKYTPPSLAKGGTWAKGVTTFMEELR